MILKNQDFYLVTLIPKKAQKFGNKNLQFLLFTFFLVVVIECILLTDNKLNLIVLYSH